MEKGGDEVCVTGGTTRNFEDNCEGVLPGTVIDYRDRPWKKRFQVTDKGTQ